MTKLFIITFLLNFNANAGGGPFFDDDEIFENLDYDLCWEQMASSEMEDYKKEFKAFVETYHQQALQSGKIDKGFAKSAFSEPTIVPAAQTVAVKNTLDMKIEVREDGSSGKSWDYITYNYVLSFSNPWVKSGVLAAASCAQVKPVQLKMYYWKYASSGFKSVDIPYPQN